MIFVVFVIIATKATVLLLGFGIDLALLIDVELAVVVVAAAGVVVSVVLLALVQSVAVVGARGVVVLASSRWPILRAAVVLERPKDLKLVTQANLGQWACHLTKFYGTLTAESIKQAFEQL